MLKVFLVTLFLIPNGVEKGMEYPMTDMMTCLDAKRQMEYTHSVPWSHNGKPVLGLAFICEERSVKAN